MVFDLSWPDLAHGLAATVAPSNRAVLAARVEQAFGDPPHRNLAFLSVRSGWSATLAALKLPPGSRVAFSGITIRDMPRIAQHHGLGVDAFDLDPDTLAPDMESLERALTPQTRVVVVAHLFGARVDLTPVHDLAQRRGLLVFEDCAQAFTGDGWYGHERSDVVFFSFGPIKTATALGGGVLRYRSAELRAAAAAVQAQWPVQRQGAFARRVLRFCGLSFLSLRPVFTAFTATCDALGKDWDAMIAQSARGFSGGDFFQRIHTQPCAALLALLERRLRQQHGPRLAARAQAARRLLSELPAHAAPGRGAPVHTHWVVPLEFADPAAAARVLRTHGFDATRGTSSMTVIGEEPQRRAPRAHTAETRWLYVPCHAGMTLRDGRRLARAIAEAASVATGASSAGPVRMTGHTEAPSLSPPPPITHST